MRSEYKKYIFFFILGAIIFGGISSVLAIQLSARDINYTKSDNTTVSIESALNELYELHNSKIDLTSKTTATTNASCYRADNVTAFIDGNDMLIRVQATKLVEDCNTPFRIDLSDLNLSTITYKKNADLGNSTRYNFTQSIDGNSISLYVDTNYGYSEKQNYNYLAYYTFTK